MKLVRASGRARVWEFLGVFGWGVGGKFGEVRELGCYNAYRASFLQGRCLNASSEAELMETITH